ncbi:hypothetical protein [Amycolatopsis speibonae]|uniref:DUF4157 domain-containing protein n=1 Tax=Amycolatopsis speibonae TaxID=1450224 RepID=A0ABV7P2A5_9PSEU
MRNALWKAVHLVTIVLAVLLLTPATAVARCTGGLVNTLGSTGDDGCGGIYPAVGSAVAVAAALAVAAGHAVLSYARGGTSGEELGRADTTGRKVGTGAKTGIDPTPESIAHGTVRMEEHSGFVAETARVEAMGFTIVAVESDPSVAIRRIVGLAGETIRTDLEFRLRPGMRYLDLEHELGHINQLFDTNRFPAGPPPSEIVTPTRNSPKGYKRAFNQSGVLTINQNAVLEYHNRLQELLWLSERGVPPDVMREHLAGAEDWFDRYRKATSGRQGNRTVGWQRRHFGDLQELEQQVRSIRTHLWPWAR